MAENIIFYGSSIALAAIGLLIALTRRNLIKIIIGLDLMETGVNMFLISIGYRRGGTAPIFDIPLLKAVDPVPQALVLTAIVIGVAVTALALTFAVRIYEKYGTLDIGKLREMKW